MHGRTDANPTVEADEIAAAWRTTCLRALSARVRGSSRLSTLMQWKIMPRQSSGFARVTTDRTSVCGSRRNLYVWPSVFRIRADARKSAHARLEDLALPALMPLECCSIRALDWSDASDADLIPDSNHAGRRFRGDAYRLSLRR